MRKLSLIGALVTGLTGLFRIFVLVLDWVGRADVLAQLAGAPLLGSLAGPVASLPAWVAAVLIIVAAFLFFSAFKTPIAPAGGRGGDASAHEGGMAHGGLGGDAGSHGPGGRGGNAMAHGRGSGAIGGRGGRGGAASGGAGGDASNSWGSGIVQGGGGGEAGQIDGRGGRGGYTIERGGPHDHQLPDGRWLSDFGRGGNGANSAEYDARLQIIRKLRTRYADQHVDHNPGTPPNARCLAWMNAELRVLGEVWQVRITDGMYEFYNVA